MRSTPLGAALRACARLAALSLLAAPALSVQAPPGYYDSVDASSAAALRATLHAVVDDHQRFPYTSGGTDTWDVLELAQEDPASPGAILDAYRNESFPAQGGGNELYNREHAWPKSYGYPQDVASNYPYTDCHSLFLVDAQYNGLRGTLAYADCNAACEELPTVFNDGQGGGAGLYPGQSNWRDGFGATGAWEAWIGRRGDLARALLYMDVRYEGGLHGVTGVAEPDLVLTDETALVDASSTGQNESLAHMGILSDLLDWHAEDPVDQYERDRNDVVFGFQGNRNPFVDHPEWVAVLYQGGTLGPLLAADVNAIDVATGGAQQLALSAGAASAGRLYLILGSASGTTPGVLVPPLLPLNIDAYLLYSLQHPNKVVQGSLGFLNGSGSAVAAFPAPAGVYSAFSGTTLHHAALVFDLPGTGAILAASNAVPLALTGGGAPDSLVVNEIDYDQPMVDTGEFVEIANPTGAPWDLANVVLELVNGATDQVYGSLSLASAGTLAPGAYLVLGTPSVLAALPPGTPSIALPAPDNNLQNGAPDGLRLFDGAVVLDSVSYEGAMTGVTEGLFGAGTDDPAGLQSLARLPDGVDTDDNAVDFAPTNAPTPGAPNAP